MNSSIPISRSQSTAAIFPFNSETASFPIDATAASAFMGTQSNAQIKDQTVSEK